MVLWDELTQAEFLAFLSVDRYSSIPSELVKCLLCARHYSWCWREWPCPYENHILMRDYCCLPNVFYFSLSVHILETFWFMQNLDFTTFHHQVEFACMYMCVLLGRYWIYLNHSLYSQGAWFLLGEIRINKKKQSQEGQPDNNASS